MMILVSAGLKARKRAQFAAAVRCITDLDDDGLRLVLGYIPAWVKGHVPDNYTWVRPNRSVTSILAF